MRNCYSVYKEPEGFTVTFDYLSEGDLEQLAEAVRSLTHLELRGYTG